LVVIEDLDALLVKKNLERRGYRVTTTTRPDEALAMFKKTSDQFDLVMTDVT
jgi:CheY-like chemotaxis protein